MNEYREQRSRILLIRSRISFREGLSLRSTPHLCELLHFTPYVSLLQTDTFRMLPPIYLPKYVAIYSILGRWQNFTPNTKYLSPHSSPVGKPFYYRATGRTLISIILAAFVQSEYEERG